MSVHSPWWVTLSHGTPGFINAYLVVLGPMLVSGIRSGMSVWKFLLSPLLAVFCMIIAVIVVALLGALLHVLGININENGFGWFMFASVVFALVGYAGGRATTSDPQNGEYQRGAVVSDPATYLRGRRLARAAGKRDRAADAKPITLAGVAIAPQDETKHFKMVGTTGTGKSTAIRELLSAALARGDRAVIADPDGGYLEHFFDAGRGDVILNPFDPGSMKWNLLGEITTEYDVDQLARSLIPDGSDKTWSEYARTFFTAVTQQVVKGGIQDDAEIHRLVTKAPLKELKLLLSGTVAGPFLEEANEKMFGSVRSVTTSALQALKYTTQQRAAPFSVRRWMREGAARHNGGRGGVLFLPYKAGEIAALRSVISAWMRIAIFEAMNRKEGDQRLWFVVDELDALGEIDGLKDALARLRKFGGRCVLGFQSISQVSTTYGKGAADTIVENCGNTLILRCSASEHGGTSQFASRLIGQREVVHTTQSQTRRPEEWLATTTISEHRAVEFAVMASEIERLPDLEGFLKFASNPDWMRATLRYVSYPAVARPAPPPAAASPEFTASSAPVMPRGHEAKPIRSKAPAATKKGVRTPRATAALRPATPEVASGASDERHCTDGDAIDPPVAGPSVAPDHSNELRE